MSKFGDGLVTAIFSCVVIIITILGIFVKVMNKR